MPIKGWKKPRYDHRPKGEYTARYRCSVCRRYKPYTAFAEAGRPRHLECADCRQTRKRDVFKQRVRIRHQQRLAARRSAERFSRSVLAGELIEFLEGVDMSRAIQLVDLPEKIAALVSQAFVCKGDDAPIDDFALSCAIKDLLDEYDPEIIARNTEKGERLVKRLPRR